MKRILEAGTSTRPAQAAAEASTCVSIQTMGRIFLSRKLNRISQRLRVYALVSLESSF